MDIRDLSIGDWVQDANGKYAQILGIEDWSDGYMLNVRINGVNVGCVSASAALPIPITPEILEKNGWKLSKSNWFELEDGEWEINIWIGKYKCNIEVSQKREIYASPYADIQVVKSNINILQHALRLVGVGKEITL